MKKANTRVLRRMCHLCGSVNKIRVPIDALLKYENREGTAKELFPDMNPLEQKFIERGYCPKCQQGLLSIPGSSDRISVA